METSDGYVLLLERIPRYGWFSFLSNYKLFWTHDVWCFAAPFYRRDARKAVYLQHGILDSSMGWVIPLFFLKKKNLLLLIMMRTWDGSSLLKLWIKKALHVSKGRLNKLPIFHCLSNSLNLDHNSHTVSIWCSSRCPMPVFLWVNLMLYFWYFTFGFLWVDSIFRWVSNGVVGSPAFAAYDQGLLWIFLEYLLQFYANHFSSAYFFFSFFSSRVWCFPWEFSWFGF